MLTLLDYGAGNVRSLANSLERLEIPYKWVESPQDIAEAQVCLVVLPVFAPILSASNDQKLLFPGVGAFGSAMKALRDKGYAQPLKDYIKSGRPYMGICIGMQGLFEGSEESPDEPGLGIIPAHVGKFSSLHKKVPHMGWNAATMLSPSQTTPVKDGMDYYFVHSYRALYKPEVQEWTLSVTSYQDETFISTVQKDNVFGTQYHPERSGEAGLAVIKNWYLQTEAPSPLPRLSLDQVTLRPAALTKRIVACLDVRSNDQGDLVVTKGDQYDVREAETSTSSSSTGNVRNLGKPVDLARRYFDEGADEIAFLNITSFRACPLDDQPMLDVVRKAAETVFVPLTIGGGIRDTTDPDGTVRAALEVAGAYFRAGADKVSIGSDAVYAVEALHANGGTPLGTSGIETINKAYGAQAVVVSVDPRRVYATSLEQIPAHHRDSAVDLSGASDGLPADLGPQGQPYCWYQCTVSGGRAVRDMDVVQLAQGVDTLGAGEILLNSVDKDGSKSGFDLRLVKLVCNSVRIPVIASSGAGNVLHFEDVFKSTPVEAALAAGIFHRKEVPLADVKAHLAQAGMPSRQRIHVL